MSRYLFPVEACLPHLPLHWPSPAVPWPPSLLLPLWVLLVFGLRIVWPRQPKRLPLIYNSIFLQFSIFLHLLSGFALITAVLFQTPGPPDGSLESKSWFHYPVHDKKENWAQGTVNATVAPPTKYLIALRATSSGPLCKWNDHRNGRGVLTSSIALPVYAVKCFLVVYEC